LAARLSSWLESQAASLAMSPSLSKRAPPLRKLDGAIAARDRLALLLVVNICYPELLEF
jgi:hypothetical protein